MDHALRRARFAERIAELEVDAVLVTRVPNVRYLCGFTGSNGQLVAWPDGAVLLTDGRYQEQARREVPDLERRIYLDSIVPAIELAVERGLRRVGFESAGVTYRSWQQLSGRSDRVELVPLGAEVERLRMAKDPEELASIARAQEAADVAFEEVVLGGCLREGVTERELALELELAMRRAGADGLGFPVIAAFGELAAEPHHEPTGRQLRSGDVVKVDFGAVVEGYRSDMTRTVAFGEPDPRLREIHDVVAAAQQAGIAAVSSGTPAGRVDLAARSVIADAGWAEAFPHGLGHGVGLEIHEDPGLRRDAEEPLPEGAVVTIEPGVYVPGLGGVRIEDMVEVTADGCRVIPRSPKELMVG